MKYKLKEIFDLHMGKAPSKIMRNIGIVTNINGYP